MMDSNDKFSWLSSTIKVFFACVVFRFEENILATDFPLEQRQGQWCRKRLVVISRIEATLGEAVIEVTNLLIEV